jgi:1-deoxy-D-xylulose-5-phosphate reductoisomerase
LDLFKIARLDFELPDFERFPCLALAYRALRAGGTAPSLMNAANEVAVEAFLDKRIAFLDIPRLIADVMDQLPSVTVSVLEDVLLADAQARTAAQEWIACS